jgi:hypothetical protein
MNTEVRTAYTVEVIEILREHTALIGSEFVDIYRLGGRVEHPEYIENVFEVGFPRFNEGHKYMLLLTWNASMRSMYSEDQMVCSRCFRTELWIHPVKSDGTVVQ